MSLLRFVFSNFAYILISMFQYIVTFYAVEWYRMTVLDVNAMKQKYEEDLKQPLTQREISKIEKKLDRIKEKGTTMKEFIRNLMDKKHLKKRTQHIAWVSLFRHMFHTIFDANDKQKKYSQ